MALWLWPEAKLAAEKLFMWGVKNKARTHHAWIPTLALTGTQKRLPRRDGVSVPLLKQKRAASELTRDLLRRNPDLSTTAKRNTG